MLRTRPAGGGVAGGACPDGGVGAVMRMLRGDYRCTSGREKAPIYVQASFSLARGLRLGASFEREKRAARLLRYRCIERQQARTRKEGDSWAPQGGRLLGRRRGACVL